VELDEVLEALPVNSDGTASIPVTVDYYGFDGQRHFQTECTFEYRRGHGLSLLTVRKKAVSD